MLKMLALNQNVNQLHINRVKVVAEFKKMSVWYILTEY